MALRLHIENSRRSMSLAHVSEDAVRQAIRRHSRFDGQLDVTIGHDGDILDEALRTTDVMISSWPPKEKLRERAPRLRWIQTTGAGIDHLLPLDWLPADIVLTNNSGPHGAKCEEFCLMALLALSSRLATFVEQQRKREWSPIFTVPVKGKHCVIIGFGDLGQAAGRACRKLGVLTTAITRSGAGSGPADTILASDRLNDVLPSADFVIVTAPLTPATRNILNRERLALLSKSAGVINVSRAALVDYQAIREMLDEDRLAGAILDVHQPEPLPSDSSLWGVRNLILTPHISCDDPRYVDMLLDCWFRNLGRFVDGQPLVNVVDPVRGY